MTLFLLRARIFLLALVVSGLAGCQWFGGGVQHSKPFTAPIMESQAPSLDQLLVYRKTLCRHPRAERRMAYQEHEQKSEERFVLERFLIASCEPAQTPGLLKQELANMKSSTFWPESYMALIDLVESHLDALERVMEQNQIEISKLKQTLEALTKIEQQMEKKE